MRASLKSVLMCGVLGATCDAFAAVQSPPAAVNVTKVAGIRQSIAKRYVGTIDCIDSVSLVARVSGEIRKQSFASGDFVKKGQLLFELEKTTYQAQRDSAAAKLQQCEADYTAAKRNLDRAVAMHKTKATSESAFDEAVRQEASAKAAASAARAALMEAENNLSYTTIYSPIDGKAGKATYSEFNYVTPSSGELVSVARLDALYVNFWVSARDYLSMFGGSYAELQKYADVKIVLADDSVYQPPKPIKIVFIDNHMDKNTDTILVRGQVENPDSKLIPDSLVTVILARNEGKEVPAIPLSAVINDGKQDFVYVVGEGNKVIRRAVVTGELQRDMQIVKSGLAIGETVVVEGVHKIYPGATVVPVPLAAGKK